jgi:membrane-associated phospholipid phosphatase
VLLLVLLVHLASEGSANVLKMLVRRLRPEELFAGHYTGLGLGATGPGSDSFSSGHTAVYLSLFWPLAVAWPRFRRPLLLLPGLLMLGRLVLGAHYLSDVWGAAWLVAFWTVAFGWPLLPETQVPLASQEQRGALAGSA